MKHFEVLTDRGLAVFANCPDDCPPEYVLGLASACGLHGGTILEIPENPALQQIKADNTHCPTCGRPYSDTMKERGRANE